ncbi:MAG: hypothetical protein IRY92_13370, partial [Dactylosporangium sp.]|nr:hypothetical protein [Dactylosporangium sp.]
MTDLDTLRSALHAPPRDVLGTLDIEQVMSAGRRLRRRRQLLAASTVATATTAVFAVAAMALNTAPAQESGLPTASAEQAAAAAHNSDPSYTPSGEVIPTGMRVDGKDLVFFVTHLPETGTIGIVGALRDQFGTLTAKVITNEPRGVDDRSPGFHAAWTGHREISHLTYGYYVGPASKITAKFGGRTVEARQATWSEDPQVVIFWFDLVEPGAGE